MTLAVASTRDSDARLLRKRSGGYSHGAGRFLHANYDPLAMAASEGQREAASPLRARVCICVGAGGVGKTTIAAALAVALAARGRKVAVVTIDPAPRLAGALGVAALASEPARIELAALGDAGIAVEGELWALRLDPKRTLDELVTRLAPDPHTRAEILANPIYGELSSAVAGAQELSAVAKLYELRHERDFDVIVLDTPPAANAIDFLHAPRRLLGFLEGRALKVFLTPGGLAARLFGRSTGVAFAIFARISGIDLFADLSSFFRSLGGVIDGFGERTRAVAALLRDPGTTFVVVTTPESQPAREAVLLSQELAAKDMPRGRLVFNRVHSSGLGGRTASDVHAALAPHVGERLASRAAANLADFDVLATRDRATIADVRASIGEDGVCCVPHMDEDVRDLATLARVGELLLDP
jgi:anion-transporting  ArsA/GET3 family ATPase